MARIIAMGFAAGAVSVLVFHQGVLFALHAYGLVPLAPFSLRPTAPLGVPQIISLAFWGGLWGIALALVMERVRGADRLWVAVLFGGVLTSVVAAIVVTPIKGGSLATWTQASTILTAFIINGAWGLGAALIYRLERRMVR